jgi:hypothetical protein
MITMIIIATITAFASKKKKKERCFSEKEKD